MIYLPPEDVQGSSTEEPNNTSTLRNLILDSKLTRILEEHTHLESHTLEKTHLIRSYKEITQEHLAFSHLTLTQSLPALEKNLSLL